MALQIPGYGVPTPYAQNPDIVGNFGKGYDLATTIGNEAAAKDALGEFVKSLYTQASPITPASAPAASPQPVSTLAMSNDPGEQMIGKSAAAATGSTDPVLAQYFKTLAQRESGNDPNAQNPNSSAGGTFQITDPTWQALVAQNPGVLSPNGKMDPQQQQVAVRLLTQQNAAALQKAGQPVNPGTLYAAHFLGAPQATQVLGYADNTPMSAAVPPEVLQANPHIADMNVGQFKQWAGVSGSTPQGGYQAPQAGPNGLPPQAVLTALFQNPQTRDFAAKMVAPYIDPSMQLDMAGKRADIALHTAQADAWSHGGGLPPKGFVYGPPDPVTGAPTLMRMSGGPTDPNVNANGPDGTPYGITGNSTIDPSVEGYASKGVAAGLTQAAIDQRALNAIISGNPPPTGRTGPAGVQAAAIANRMAELDPSGNLAANKTVLRSLSSTLTDQTKYLNNTERAFNTATDTLANLQTYMQQNGVNPSEFPDANALGNYLQSHGKDAGTVAAYRAQLTTLRQEYSQVLAKGGARSVETDREASSLIPENLGPAQLAQVAAQIKIDSDNAINEAKKQVSSVTSQINGIANGNNPTADATAPSPADAAAPPPAGADAAPTVTAVDANGNRIGLVNGAWVAIK